MANLLEWTDTAALGELEPRRLHRLAIESMRLRLLKLRSAEKKTELTRLIETFAKTTVGRYSHDRYVPRSEIVHEQIKQSGDFNL